MAGDFSTGEFRNGDKVFKLLTQKIEDVHADVRITREQLDKLREEQAKHQIRLDSLPCATHTQVMSELDDTVRSALGWKSIVVAIIPAVVAGLLLGSRFL